MTGKPRAFGALTFWSAVVMVAMSPVMLLLYWLRSGGGYFMWWWATGLFLLLVAAGFIAGRRLRQLAGMVLDGDSASGRLRVPRRLRVPPRFEMVLLLQPVVGVMVIWPTINAAQDYGMLMVVITYPVMWVCFQCYPWVMWARNRDQDPLPPKPGVNGRSSGVHVWNLTTADQDAEHVEVAVRLDRELSVAQVLREVVRTPVLPALKGGKRTWVALVDGAEAGVLTQTWEHPRWWPAIVWSVDASSPFDGERIRFEPSDR